MVSFFYFVLYHRLFKELFNFIIKTFFLYMYSHVALKLIVRLAVIYKLIYQLHNINYTISIIFYSIFILIFIFIFICSSSLTGIDHITIKILIIHTNTINNIILILFKQHSLMVLLLVDNIIMDHSIINIIYRIQDSTLYNIIILYILLITILN
jgi:hypothetical protein